MPMELGKGDLLKRLREAFSAMMGTLHKQKGASLDIQIMADPSVTDFIEQHSSVLDSAIQQQPMSEGMRNRLQRSNYIFSGMKTFHELNEAFPSLLDENGNRKPFEQFLNEVQNIDSKYNSNYLRAEYNFVQASAEMAAKWEQFMEDGDRYYLQYRTQKDDKVRPEHAALDGVTLPPSDSFWEEYYPPNGWNCRCTVVQVRKSKYPATPHDEAMARGQVALDKDTRGIFHFNPGIEKKTVPDYNPYTIKRCRDCDISSKLAGYIPDNEVCAACQIIHAQKQGKCDAQDRILKYDEKTWERTYISKNGNGLVATQHERIKEASASNTERQKFEKEIRMCKVIADNGHDVEYLQGVNRPVGQTYYVTIDGIKADLKCITGGAGNIVKYATKALTKQGGDAVIFELPSHDSKYYASIAEARRKNNGRIFFYFVDEKILKEIKK